MLNRLNFDNTGVARCWFLWTFFPTLHSLQDCETFSRRSKDFIFPFLFLVFSIKTFGWPHKKFINALWHFDVNSANLVEESVRRTRSSSSISKRFWSWQSNSRIQFKKLWIRESRVDISPNVARLLWGEADSESLHNPNDISALLNCYLLVYKPSRTLMCSAREPQKELWEFFGLYGENL